MSKISTWDYFKKRWLYYLSFVFIFIIPAVMIILKLVTIKSNEHDVSISFGGFILGMVYIAFVSKKVKTKIHDMKPSATKILATTISSIIPFITVGFLIVLVKNSLNGFEITAFAICVFILFGGLLQAIEFVMNKKFLYRLKIDEMAREEVDKKRRMKELEQELEYE